jgi:hypothetical protein
MYALDPWRMGTTGTRPTLTTAPGQPTCSSAEIVRLRGESSLVSAPMHDAVPSLTSPTAREAELGQPTCSSAEIVR